MAKQALTHKNGTLDPASRPAYLSKARMAEISEQSRLSCPNKYPTQAEIDALNEEINCALPWR